MGPLISLAQVCGEARILESPLAILWALPLGLIIIVIVEGARAIEIVRIMGIIVEIFVIVYGEATVKASSTVLKGADAVQRGIMTRFQYITAEPKAAITRGLVVGDPFPTCKILQHAVESPNHGVNCNVMAGTEGPVVSVLVARAPTFATGHCVPPVEYSIRRRVIGLTRAGKVVGDIPGTLHRHGRRAKVRTD